MYRMPGNIRDGIFSRKAYFVKAGHHIYKDVWVPDPMRPEVLTCVREAGNDADPYSVAMINSSMTVVDHESVINGRRRDT